MSDSRRHLADAQRIVVKLGTHVVTDDGVDLAIGRLTGIVEGVARLRRQGRDVVMVSSGAVMMGVRALGLAGKPRELALKQACAAAGQSHLMHWYTEAFKRFGVTAAQVLLTEEDLADRERALSVRTVLMRLLELGAVPVLNENDSVGVRELIARQHVVATPASRPGFGFGDNDGLSARVAVCLDADLLVLLTNVSGLYTANPKHDPTASRISELAAIDDVARSRASGSSAGGTGGMASKLDAAALATSEGTTVLIAGGAEPNVLDRALAGVDLGTLIAAPARRRARERHIAVGARSGGALVVNAGALKALNDSKASLLPIGVVSVDGNFEQGDVVEVRDGSGRVHGRGIVNYPAAACRKLAGRHSDDIDTILGYRGYDALITRDNLMMGAV
jgi:glutamate 5-kinase